MSNFIYIMGKSATGKDTIYKKLLKQLEINTYVPYTTRPKRAGEKQGKEYFFITNEQFEEIQKMHRVMEYRSYNVINSNGENDIWTYATVDDKQWKREGDFITTGTLESYKNILAYLKQHPERDISMLPIYISIDERERRKRAIEREQKQQKPNFEEMRRRLKADNLDFSAENLMEAGITKNETFENYDLQKCVDNILEYVSLKTNVKTSKKEIEEEER